MQPARLVTIFTELVILALGLLLILLVLSGRFTMPPGLALWAILGALLVIWGLRTWVRRKEATRLSARLLQWLRSVSLVVAGTVMLLMTWAPLGNKQLMLATVGAVLAVRGLFGIVLASIAMRG